MLKLNLVMVGSENPEPLVEFYTKVLGEPAWNDGGFVGWQSGSGAGFMIGAHSEPGR